MSPEDLRAAIDAAEHAITGHHRERLLSRSELYRETGRLAGYPDLPVHQPYLDDIRRITRRTERHKSRWLNAVSMSLTADELSRVSTLPFVERTAPVGRFRKLEAVPAVPVQATGSASAASAGYRYDYGPSFGQLNMLRVPEAHDMGLNGSGVIICCMDTGFYKSHQALQSMNIIAEHDFVFDDDDTQNSPDDAADQHRHGTGVVAVIGAFVPGQLIGPAFGASFILAKTEDTRSETQVEEDNWVAAMEWADALGADVISASLGYRWFDDGSSYSHEELDGRTAVTTIAANTATERGIVVATAMGNEGPASGSLIAPADAFKVLSCGAVDGDLALASFSSRGPTGDGRLKPEVCAQGVATHWASASDPFAYGFANGTSLSTPLIGGISAIIVGAHPDWTPRKVREALCFSASWFNVANNDVGHGVPDLIKALLDPRRADVDGSGRVDGVDLLYLGLAFGSADTEGGEGRWNPDADLDGNGTVDGDDLALLSSLFGRLFPAGF